MPRRRRGSDFLVMGGRCHSRLRGGMSIGFVISVQDSPARSTVLISINN